MSVSKRTWVIAFGAVAAVLVAAGVTFAALGSGTNSAGGATPPPLASHASDVYRIPVTGLISKSIPPVPAVEVVLPGSAKIGLLLAGPGENEKADYAQIGFCGAAGCSQIDWHDVTDGDVVKANGVRVKVIKLWRMSDWRNNAVDVQADPAA